MECMENGGTLFQSTMSGSNINQVGQIIILRNCMCIRVYVYMCTRVYVYIYTYMCILVHVHMCICVYVYTCIRVSGFI